MNSLNEHTIKKVGLGYLKRHYRYHPRVGDTESGIDMRGEGDIIVDAYMKFHHEDGSDFIITLEATSFDTKDEVCYKTQEKLLTWDGVASALFGTSGLFLFTLIKDISLIKLYGTTMVIAMLCISFVFLFLFHRLFFSALRRYRYIYAVEQFKNYHASEQWIALGTDVFADTENKYFKELKKQCVYNGIGLFSIDENKKPTIYMTPSRADVFDSTRKSIELVSLNDFTAQLGKHKYTKWLGNLKLDLRFLKPRSQNTGLFRFQKNYFNQMAFSLLSFLAICGVFYKHYQEKPIDYVDEEAYVLERQASNSTTTKEPLGYLVDSQFVAPYLDRVPPYVNLEKDTIDWLEVAVKRKKGSKRVEKTKKNNPQILISVGKNQEWIEYDCERFYTFTSTKYIVEESRHASLEMAAQRMEELERLNYEANTIWMGCFFQSQVYYSVFLGPLISSRNEAEQELRYYNQNKKLKGPVKNLNLVAIPAKE